MLISEKDFSYEIREAREEDWKPAMNMVWKTFLEFEGKDYAPEGIRNFYDFITDDGLYEAFLMGEYRVWVALEKERIVGLASIRDRNRLSLLFVDEAYHRRGIGRSLITCLSDYLKNQKRESRMYLKAAPYAVKFYKKMGFRALGPEEETSGIRVTAMMKFL